MTFSALRFAILACLGGTGCIVFSDPINVSPQVIMTAPTAIHRGEPAVFVAEASDADEGADTLDLRWGRMIGPCPAALHAGAAVDADFKVAGEFPTPEIAGSRYVAVVTTLDPLCVWVVASDRHGAKAVAAADATVTNLPPQIRIAFEAPAATGPFAIFSDFRLRAAPALATAATVDPDNDPVGYTWTLTGPGGVAGSLPACAGSHDGAAVCFRLENPGSYSVTLTAADGQAGPPATAAAELVVAPDRPPCIAVTDPIARVPLNPTEARKFSIVNIDDDGDPFPPPPDRQSAPTFTWSLRRPGEAEFQRRVGYTSYEYFIPADTYRTGDVVELRVEIDDRTRRGPALCPMDQAECALSPGCRQRVTWTVGYLL